jgi:hypothetical protein
VPHPTTRTGPLRRHRAGPARHSSSEAKAKAASPPPEDNERRGRLSWAELLLRVFLVDVLTCPRCQGRENDAFTTPFTRPRMSCYPRQWPVFAAMVPIRRP